MPSTNHNNFQLLPTGPVDWVAVLNDMMTKIEAGRTMRVTAGEALSQYQVARRHTDGKAYKATTTSRPTGIVKANIALSTTGFLQVDGFMSNPAWSWTPGAILYASASGALSTTPTEYPVALGLSATEIYIFGDAAHGHSIITLLNSGGLRILDTDGSHTLNIVVGSDLSATRTLTITTGDADRVITLSGNPTLADWFDQSVKTSADVVHASIVSRKAQDMDFDTDEVLSTGIGASYGLLIVKETTAGVSAVYRVQNQSLITISADATFSTTKDNASTYNVYWETDQFKVQNKAGDNKAVTVGLFGV